MWFRTWLPAQAQALPYGYRTCAGQPCPYDFAPGSGLSEFHVSASAFQLPSACFFQTARYLPWSVTAAPLSLGRSCGHGVGTEDRKTRSPAFADLHVHRGPRDIDVLGPIDRSQNLVAPALFVIISAIRGQHRRIVRIKGEQGVFIVVRLRRLRPLHVRRL